MFFLPLCKYFFFYGIKPIRRISRHAFQFKLLFFSLYIFDRKERLDSGQVLVCSFFFTKKAKTTTKNRLQLGLLGIFCLSAQQEDAAAFCFWVSIAPPFFSPYTYHPVFFFCFLLFFLIFFQLWAAPASPCVWFGPHTSNPFPLYYVYYFSILVRLCLCSLAVCALSVCCCCFIIFDFFFPPFFLVFLVVRFFNQKILGISCLRGMKTNEKRMKVRWSRGHKNTMIHGNKTVLAHVQRHHLAVSS